MIDYNKILNIPPYSLPKTEKEELLKRRLADLTQIHRNGSIEYKRILNCLGFDADGTCDISDIPFIPVSLFKELDLYSVPKEALFKTMTSSGTSGQAVSRIYLDRGTASNQQKTLAKIVTNFTGPVRMPMLIIDSPSVLKNRDMFSARGAGILGFSIFGTEKVYALNDDMTINVEAIQTFVAKHYNTKVLLFGFTFMVWQHFYKELKRLDIRLDLPKGILIHGGGWKKIVNEAVSQDDFKRKIFEVSGVKSVHDYYGMVEQTGCIYMECEHGHLHASIFSDIITRRHTDFSPCEIGETGIIQVLSMLPESYPGHSLLTEDEGVILGEDDCPCGRKGKYFKVLGRLKNAEIRGCSDTYEIK